MTDYERRLELLNQTKRTTSSDFCIAADESVPKQKSTLGIRITISILCFIGYVFFDYGRIAVSDVNAKMIVQEIGRQITLDSILPNDLHL